MIAAMVLLGVRCLAQDYGDSQKVSEMAQRSGIAVQGGVGVEQFYMAVMRVVNPYYAENNINSVKEEEEGTFELDRKNGYIRYFSEGGDCGLEVQCCYWKRPDGTLLVGFYYRLQEADGPYDAFLYFYNYNAAKHCLDYLEPPLDTTLQGDGPLQVKLPRYGKDIQYRFGRYEDGGSWTILKWANGRFS